MYHWATLHQHCIVIIPIANTCSQTQKQNYWISEKCANQATFADAPVRIYVANCAIFYESTDFRKGLPKLQKKLTDRYVAEEIDYKTNSQGDEQMCPLLEGKQADG